MISFLSETFNLFAGNMLLSALLFFLVLFRVF